MSTQSVENISLITEWEESFHQFLEDLPKICTKNNNGSLAISTCLPMIASPVEKVLKQFLDLFCSILSSRDIPGNKNNQVTEKGFSKSGFQTSRSVYLSPLVHFNANCETIPLYLSKLISSQQCQELSSKINEICSYWLKKLMKLPEETSCFFGKDEMRSRVLVCRCALQRHFRSISTKGYLGFDENVLPKIYIGSKDFVLIGENLCLEMGLPRACIHFLRVPYGTSNVIDIASLEEAIVLDIEEGHRPCLVIVSAGMSHIDDIVEVRRLCDLHNIWLHVEGEASSLLLCTFPPPAIRSILLCDSIIVRPSEWCCYQLLSTVIWTCFPSANKLESYNSFVSNYNAQNNLFASLPLYLAMLRLGTGNLVEFMDHSVLLANHLRGLLGALPSIIVSLEDTLPIVTFRYAPASLSESENTTLLSRLNEQVFPYFDLVSSK